MSKRVPYNLNFLAKSVFELDKEHQKIIKFLAEQENDKGINQTDMANSFTKSNGFHNRKTIKKKLLGTNRMVGLIPNEYVIPKKEQKRRYGKDEISFQLTFKGLFGALASGVQLKKIYSYNKFLNGVDHYVKNKKINKIIKKYYELQIHSFLLWHYIYGIQLKNMTMFQTYYDELDKKEFSHTKYFGVRVHPDIIKKSNDKETIFKEANLRNESTTRGKEEIFVTKITNIFSSYFVYKGMINVLRIKGIIPTANDFLKKDMNLPDSDEALDFDKLIDYWSFYIDDVHLAESPVDILYRDTNRMPSQYNITFLSQAFSEEIKKNEKKLLKNDKDKSLKKTMENIKENQMNFNLAYMPRVTNEIKKMLKKNKIDANIPDGMKRIANVYTF